MAQFTVPTAIVTPPGGVHAKSSSDLAFNYESSPFAFWITRRDDPSGAPLFDTRVTSLPKAPVAPLNASDPSTAFDSFQLAFEDQYLQVRRLLFLSRKILMSHSSPPLFRSMRISTALARSLRAQASGVRFLARAPSKQTGHATSGTRSTRTSACSAVLSPPDAFERVVDTASTRSTSSTDSTRARAPRAATASSSTGERLPHALRSPAHSCPAPKPPTFSSSHRPARTHRSSNTA